MPRAITDIDWGQVIRLGCKRVEPASRPKAAIVDPVAAQLPEVFTRLAINTPARQAHFIAQAIHECQYFQTLTELASGDAYDQRTDMGFTAAKDGDGRLHKGFGIFQTTGPNNQRRALQQLKALGFNVSQNINDAKTVLTNPKWAAWTAGIFWRDNKLNAVADADKTGSRVSRAVNRGNPNSKKAAYHEAERCKAFRIVFAILQNPPLLASAARAAPVAAAALMPGGGEDLELPDIQGADVQEMAAALGRVLPGGDLADKPGIGETPEAPGMPLEPGPDSPPVPLPDEPVAPNVPEVLLKAAQQRLRDLGFYQVGLPNGDAGARTVAGVAAFQHVAGIPVTGQLDGPTMTSLWSADAPSAPVSPERALATKDDVRAAGSKVIDATDKVQTTSLWQMVSGAGLAVGTAVMSGFSSTMETLRDVREYLSDVPGWAWAIGVAVILGAPALYTFVQAQRAARARVEDFRSGKAS